MPPISAAQLTALEQAAHWYSCLNDEAATEADRLAWQTWLQAAPLNAWAWEQAERLQQRMLRVPGPLAERTLDLAGRERQTSRRGVLKGLALVIGGSTLGWGGYRQASQGPWLADYRSQVGERLPVTLEDGSQLLLNSDSAVDIVFDGQQRLVLLKQGEIMVTTAADPHQRPFSVQTRQGRVLALGTRFTVREQDTTTTVAVFEHKVQITTHEGQTQLLTSGQRCQFDRQAVHAPTTLDFAEGAWSRGLLVANDQRLEAFVAELGRYRRGWLRCDPAVADLRISGTFDLRDTDQILRALSGSLPVRVVQRTRYWVNLVPA
ncbi:FecR domain-containing protein [Pseudomonas sp. MAFF 302046]|uniref:FecR domain-containing protein n=1 Tax=Pseudomonas morbosilactucae TaxID=2938197 RepID=A0ABT0JFT8_9PSED|nr:FecR domain-containing protein [Pseudomonas morbosilactucae]MCK9814738.1 FecR domain-containing protein [Pseudomonas morbosilactucae]